MSSSRTNALFGRVVMPTGHSIRRLRRIYGWLLVGAGVLTLTGLGAALAAVNRVPTAAKCVENESFTIELKDWTTARLTDGTHVLASLKTSRGVLEARVNIKLGKPVSEPEWFLNGKLLKEIDPAKLRPAEQECLKTSSATYRHGSALIQVAQSVLDLIVPTAYASCVSAAGSHVFITKVCYDYGGGPVCVLEHRVNGKFCRYVVV